MNFWSVISAKHKKYRDSMRKSFEASGSALALAKRAIFALHRADLKNGEKLLRESAKALTALTEEIQSEPMLAGEGAFRAALEEHIEAGLFLQFVKNKPLGEIKGLKAAPEIYIAGLSDLAGEIARYAVSAAAGRDKKEVSRAKKTAEWIISYLLEMDLTGYLRTKFDQAKNALRKIEDIAYDLSLRG